MQHNNLKRSTYRLSRTICFVYHHDSHWALLLVLQKFYNVDGRTLRAILHRCRYNNIMNGRQSGQNFCNIHTSNRSDSKIYYLYRVMLLTTAPYIDSAQIGFLFSQPQKHLFSAHMKVFAHFWTTLLAFDSLTHLQHGLTLGPPRRYSVSNTRAARATTFPRLDGI